MQPMAQIQEGAVSFQNQNIISTNTFARPSKQMLDRAGDVGAQNSANDQHQAAAHLEAAAMAKNTGATGQERQSR